jgi:hypothetical protein
MYRLYIDHFNTGQEQVLEFESAKSAIIYKEYHTTFGDWKYNIEWIEEKNLTKELKQFIVDQRIEVKDKKVLKFYKIARGIKIRLEEVCGTAIEECWQILKSKRDTLLKETDYTQLSDAPFTTAVKLEYRNYRDYLRNLPSLHNNDTILHAEVRSFEEFKIGLR